MEYNVRKNCTKAQQLVQAAEDKINLINDASERSLMYMSIGKFYGSPGDCKESIKESKSKEIEYYKKAASLMGMDYKSFLEMQGVYLK